MAVDAQRMQSMIDLYIEAEQAVLFGKETQFNGRKAVMADLPAIREGRAEWERRLNNMLRAQQGASGFSLAEFS